MRSPAPELAVERWFNTDHDIALADLRGQVVVIETFQMLCPACVSYGLPQAQRVLQAFADELVVLGLHTVFEHHTAMSPTSLEVFLAEYRIGFPVGVDAHEAGFDAPLTMRRYELQGTPTTIIIDRSGDIRLRAFGRHDDLSLGSTLRQVIDEEPTERRGRTEGCSAPTHNTTNSKDQT